MLFLIKTFITKVDVLLHVTNGLKYPPLNLFFLVLQY